MLRTSAWRAGAVGLLAGLAVCFAAPSPASAGAVGWLTVKCTPTAGLTIDGTDVGMTPVTHYELSADHHDLVFTVAGKRPRRMRVVVNENLETSLDINM